MKSIYKYLFFSFALLFFGFFHSSHTYANSHEEPEQCKVSIITPESDIGRSKPITFSIKLPDFGTRQVCDDAKGVNINCFELKYCLEGGDDVFDRKCQNKDYRHVDGQSLKNDTIQGTVTSNNTFKFWLELDEKGTRNKDVCKIRDYNRVTIAELPIDCSKAFSVKPIRNEKVVNEFPKWNDILRVNIDTTKINNFGFGQYQAWIEPIDSIDVGTSIPNIINVDSSGVVGWKTAGAKVNIGPLVKTGPGWYHFVMIGVADNTRYCASEPFYLLDDKEVEPPESYGGGPLSGRQLCAGSEATQCSNCLNSGGAWTALGCIPIDNLSDFILGILGFAAGIAGGITFLLIVWGGLKYLMSRGNPEAIAESHEIITNAIAGLLLIIFAAILMRIIGVDILRIPGFGGP